MSLCGGNILTPIAEGPSCVLSCVREAGWLAALPSTPFHYLLAFSKGLSFMPEYVIVNNGFGVTEGGLVF